MSKKQAPLARGELEILHYVAEYHPIKVGTVAEHFASTSGKARTTILTVMERLRAKGHLTRKKIDGTWHYSPKLARTELMRGLVRRFVHESLGGSLAPFMAYLATEAKSLTDEELKALKQLVRELDSQRRGEN
ncbi:MAG: BlaI/MecI/CopY family transcriptional regulator [Planctomycetales bacterium]|nr:BlaI/MecI/CopY family transcriptional regulator [Planctomycetales bacterium]